MPYTQVPKAPPHTLILASSTFPNFANKNGEEATVVKFTGPRLELRAEGAAAQQRFLEQVCVFCVCTCADPTLCSVHPSNVGAVMSVSLLTYHRSSARP